MRGVQVVPPHGPCYDPSMSPAEPQQRLGTVTAIDDPKIARLVSVLKDLGQVAVAYSGGVDSAFLLKAAWDVLGQGATGVLAWSESMDRNEYAEAQKVATAMGIPIRTIETRELTIQPTGRTPRTAAITARRNCSNG